MSTKELTPQEIFTKVVLHARKQRKHAMTDEGCVYRGEDGCECFAGCLIDDACYSPELEFSVAGTPKVAAALTKSGAFAGLAGTTPDNPYRRCLISDLQDIHDGTDGIADWERQFRKVAARYGLVVPEPTDEFPMLPETAS